MRKALGLLILIYSLFLFNCGKPASVVYSDNLLLQFPSEPALFQKEYGGRLKYHSAERSTVEKRADMNQAELDGDGLEVVFWSKEHYYIAKMAFTKNRLKVGGVSVIGKKVPEIERIFGNPTTVNEMGTLIYNGEKTILALAVERGTVTRCDMGYEF